MRTIAIQKKQQICVATQSINSLLEEESPDSTSKNILPTSILSDSSF